MRNTNSNFAHQAAQASAPHNNEKKAQGPTDFPEGGQLLPAGDEGAGARHSMTLAVHSSLSNNSLCEGELKSRRNIEQN